MIRRQRLALFSFILGTFLALGCLVKAAPSGTKEVVLVTGYLDDPHGFLPSVHLNSTATFVENEIRAVLVRKGFSLRDDGSWNSRDHSVHLTLINANVICPGEFRHTDRAERWDLCPDQWERMKALRAFLEQGAVNHFDEFIYLGHARQGAGLGIGPNDPTNKDFTFPINEIFWYPRGFDGTSRRLARVLFATCNGENNYGFIGTNYKLDFVTTKEFRLTWDVLLEVVKTELNSL